MRRPFLVTCGVLSSLGMTLGMAACSPMSAVGSGDSSCPAGVVAASMKESVGEYPKSTQAQSSVGTLGTFTVAGTIQYQRFLPTTSGGSKIDYASTVTTLPVRRAIVQIMNGSVAIASGMTDDTGAYSIPLSVASGTSIFVRVQARSTVTAYVKDGLGGTAAENCNGGSWDVRVVNNVTNNTCSASTGSSRPLYVLDGSAFAAVDSGTVTKSMTASMAFASGAYTNRSGAPFALLDTAISGLETVCQGAAATAFPVIYMNWSKDNTSTSGNRYQGNISTSFFTTESSDKTANLYILGKINVDTDELDNHVVAHEFGHFIENKIYRSDSIGGAHSLTDSLDPRLAFGEGFGNAFSGMVHSDPLYIDTNGASQASGFNINVSTAPAADDDRGPWSEASMQYLLYSLWSSQSSYSRIHNVLLNYQKTSSAATSGLTFASYYAQAYTTTGNGLNTLWSGASNLSSPVDAFCAGTCGTSYEPWDADNDMGTAYASTRRYRQGGTGSAFTAEFWRQYRTLTSGANTGNAHDQMTFGGYGLTSTNLNKLGLHRLYRYVATATTTTINVSSITQSGVTCSSADILDMAIYYKGTLVGLDEAASGSTASCPSVTFATTIGETYIIDMAGFGVVSAYTLTVSP